MLPEHLVRNLAASRPHFAEHLHQDARIRSARSVSAVPAQGPVEVYDAAYGTRLPGEKAEKEAKEEADRIRAWALAARTLWDVPDLPDAVVRYGSGYANAFWDGTWLVFGSGDGEVFADFTADPSVFAHEAGHFLTSSELRLDYFGATGILSEHLADVRAASLQSFVLGLRDGQWDWRIGQKLFLDGTSALRDMRHPGTAYDSPLLGRDPQMGHMDAYRPLGGDSGGVHVFSGIPNRAFAVFCENSGLAAHGEPWRIWRDAVRQAPDQTPFTEFGRLTVQAAPEGLKGAVAAAWKAVGL